MLTVMTRKFLNDDREYVLYGRAPTRAIALAVKAGCEDNGTTAVVTKSQRHYYIWVEDSWMQFTRPVTFVPDSTDSVPC